MKANDQSFTENMFPYFCGVYDVINLREWVLLTYLVFLYLPSDFDGISTHSWAQSKGSIFLFWHWGTCDVTNDDVIILREWALLTYLVFFYLPSDFREILFYIQVSTVRMLQFSLRHQSLRRLWVFSSNKRVCAYYGHQLKSGSYIGEYYCIWYYFSFGHNYEPYVSTTYMTPSPPPKKSNLLTVLSCV